jgi:hypothetical protein
MSVIADPTAAVADAAAAAVASTAAAAWAFCSFREEGRREQAFEPILDVPA